MFNLSKTTAHEKTILYYAVALTTIGARAVTNYNIFVAGTEVTSENCNAIAGNSGWYYSEWNNTLVISSNIIVKDVAAIENNNTTGTLTVSIRKGCDTISSNTWGIFSMSDLTVGFNNSSCCIRSSNLAGINSAKKMTISNGINLDISGRYGIGCKNDTLTIDNTSATVKGTERAIDCKGLRMKDSHIQSGSTASTQIQFASGVLKYMVTAESSPSGFAFFEGTGAYEAGSPVTVSCMPEQGWHFVKWSGNTTNRQISFTMPEHDVQLTAELDTTSYDIWYKGNQASSLSNDRGIPGGSWYIYHCNESEKYDGPNCFDTICFTNHITGRVGHEENRTILKVGKRTCVRFRGSSLLKTSGDYALEFLNEGSIVVEGEAWLKGGIKAVEGANIRVEGEAVVAGGKSLSDKAILIAKPWQKKILLPKEFSVGEGRKVLFASGNLQHNDSVDLWRLAESQYDCFLPSNDPFTAFSHVHFTPTDTDWKNALFIDNNNRALEGMRVPTIDEWEYLLRGRKNAAYLWGLSITYDQRGIIILPDEWECPKGLQFKATSVQAIPGFSDNMYNLSEWEKMEEAGAVFLPCYGYSRDGKLVNSPAAYYMSATVENGNVRYLEADSPDGRGYAVTTNALPATNGMNIRLVRDAAATALDETINPFTHSSFKQMVNGQLIIIRDGVKYNALGQIVE